MGTRFFSGEELQQYALSSVWEEQDEDYGRWSVGVVSVFQAEDDGKFYRFRWSRGLTEMQEDEIYDSECDEVFPFDVLTVKSSLSYLTEEEKEQSAFSINKKSVYASKLISDSAAEGIEALKAFDVGPVSGLLAAADSVLLDDNGQAFVKAAKVLFDELAVLQKKLK